MKTLPAGTVTFLFTDIEASTVLLRRLDYMIPVAERAYLDQLVDSLRRSLPADEFETASSQGRHLSLEQALDAAHCSLSDAESPPESRAPESGP